MAVPMQNEALRRQGAAIGGRCSCDSRRVTLLTPREAANRLGIHVRSLQRIIASGDLPVVRVLSSTPRIRLEDLTDFIENRTVYRAKVNENAC